MNQKARAQALRFGVAALAIVALFFMVNNPKTNDILYLYWLPILVASLSVLLGHSLRMQRTSILLNAAGVKSTLKQQIAPLSIGLMLNVFLPLKLGEVGRAFLLAQNLKISKTYSLVVVFVERLLDVALVSSALLVTLFFAGSDIPIGWWIFGISALSLSFGTIFALSMAIQEKRIIFRIISKVSKTLNQDIQYRVQHSSYSIIHGFQVFLTSGREIAKYSVNFLGSWFLYIFATGVLSTFLLGPQGSWASMVGPLITAGNLSGTFGPLDYANDILEFVGLTTEQPTVDTRLISFGIAAWLALQASIVFVGLIALLTNYFWQSSSQVSTKVLTSKVSRANPQAKNLRNFFELYFDRHELARSYHLEDVSGESQILGFFRGGSAAITALIRKSNELRVRKTTDLENKSKLKAQYEWLKRNSEASLLVRAIEERATESLYSIDLEFNQSSEAFFDFIHTQPKTKSKMQLVRVFEFLENEIWKIGFESNDQESLDRYLQNRFFSRLQNACSSNPELRKIREAEVLMINGAKFLNLGTIVHQILENENLKARLANFRNNEQMHGDLTVDNLLIEIGAEQPILIDPSDDNEFRSTALEFSRMHQSLAGGYEFVNNYQGQPVVSFEGDGSTAVIDYLNFQSQAYEYLDEELMQLARHYLTPDEFSSIDFFTGIFFGRMLDHRVKIDAKTAPIYYAKAVEFLAKFLEENS